MASQTGDLSKHMGKLSVSTTVPPKSNITKKKAVPVAESWEDEADDDSDTETEDSKPTAPPPTPASPTGRFRSEVEFDGGETPYHDFEERSDVRSNSDRRPEKSTAVASRLIAGALGVRNKRTEEQRAYDKAIREKELRKREKEKEERAKAEEEKAKAKAAIWED